MENEIKKKKERRQHKKEDEELVKKIKDEEKNTHNVDSLIGKIEKEGEKAKKKKIADHFMNKELKEISNSLDLPKKCEDDPPKK